MLEIFIYIAFAILLCWSLYMNYKLGKIVLNIEEEIEVALDSLDERYKSISKILQVPLYYDSPEIRQVLYDVEKTRIAILKIASSMGAAIDEDTAD